MNPTASDVHVDAALSDLAIAAGAQQYVWDQLAPVVPVEKQSDKYFVFNDDDFRRNEAAIRAPGTVAQRGGYQISTDTYYCDDYAFGQQIVNEVERNADGPINPERDATMYVTEATNRAIEIQWVSEVFVASVWDTDVTGASSTNTNQVIYWSTYATSTPIQDVREYADAIQLATGMRPNRLALGRQVLSELMDHPDIVDRLPVGAMRDVTLAHLAQLLDVEQIVVGSASYNTASKFETASNSFAWGKNALLYYAPSSPSITTPSALYSFRWGPRQVLNYDDAPAGRMAKVIEVHDYVDVKVTGSAYGVFFSGIVA